MMILRRLPLMSRARAEQPACASRTQISVAGQVSDSARVLTSARPAPSTEDSAWRTSATHGTCQPTLNRSETPARATPSSPRIPLPAVTVFSGNQFRGGGNPGNQLQDGSAVLFKQATGAAWQTVRSPKQCGAPGMEQRQFHERRADPGRGFYDLYPRMHVALLRHRLYDLARPDLVARCHRRRHMDRASKRHAAWRAVRLCPLGSVRRRQSSLRRRRQPADRECRDHRSRPGGNLPGRRPAP